MSFLTQSTSTDESPFKDLIQRDNDICNNCFRKTHDTIERNFAIDTYRDGGESELWARKTDLPDRSWKLEHNTTYIPAEPASQGTYVSCKCGIDTMRPVPTEMAMRFSKRLCDRLYEKRVDFDSDVLLDTVRRKMQQPSKQGKQDEGVFSEAVNKAIAHR